MQLLRPQRSVAAFCSKFESLQKSSGFNDVKTLTSDNQKLAKDKDVIGATKNCKQSNKDLKQGDHIPSRITTVSFVL